MTGGVVAHPTQRANIAVYTAWVMNLMSVPGCSLMASADGESSDV
jgi:hypothetical protein